MSAGGTSLTLALHAARWWLHGLLLMNRAKLMMQDAESQSGSEDNDRRATSYMHQGCAISASLWVSR